MIPPRAIPRRCSYCRPASVTTIRRYVSPLCRDWAGLAAEYNQPALRMRQAGKRGGAASIRIDDPNPDIEFVETGVNLAGAVILYVEDGALKYMGSNGNVTVIVPA